MLPLFFSWKSGGRTRRETGKKGGKLYQIFFLFSSLISSSFCLAECAALADFRSGLPPFFPPLPSLIRLYYFSTFGSPNRTDEQALEARLIAPKLLKYDCARLRAAAELWGRVAGKRHNLVSVIFSERILCGIDILRTWREISFFFRFSPRVLPHVGKKYCIRSPSESICGSIWDFCLFATVIKNCP